MLSLRTMAEVESTMDVTCPACNARLVLNHKFAEFAACILKRQIKDIKGYGAYTYREPSFLHSPKVTISTHKTII